MNKFCDKFNYVTHFKTYKLTFVHLFKTFCNISFLMHPSLWMATRVVEICTKHTMFTIRYSQSFTCILLVSTPFRNSWRHGRGLIKCCCSPVLFTFMTNINVNSISLELKRNIKHANICFQWFLFNNHYVNKDLELCVRKWWPALLESASPGHRHYCGTAVWLV